MKCPICRKEADQTYRPFCSKRCADRDLGNWLDGAYAIQSEETPGEGSVEGPDPDHA